MHCGSSVKTGRGIGAALLAAGGAVRFTGRDGDRTGPYRETEEWA